MYIDFVIRSFSLILEIDLNSCYAIITFTFSMENLNWDAVLGDFFSVRDLVKDSDLLKLNLIDFWGSHPVIAMFLLFIFSFGKLR